MNTALALVAAMTTLPALFMSSAAASSTAYTGTPVSVPGRINAEAFDNGGSGVAYFDTTPGNSGGQVRATDVDIEASSEGGYDIGWTAAGEWLNYSVSVQAKGNYTVQLRVASLSGGSMHVGFNGPSHVWSTVAIPATGGWQNWTTVNVPVTLGAGPQLMTLLFDTGGVNFHYSMINAAATTVAPTTGPYSGQPLAVPGTIQAENFDNGSEGSAYHDTTSGNSGGVYRSTGVDLEACAEGGYDVGWTTAGEWLNYTITVPSAGNYTVGLRVASGSGGTVHVGFNGASNVSKSVAIPSTGGWQTWTTVNVTVALGAGVQQMTVRFDTGGVNLNYVKIAAGAATTPPTGSTLSVATWNIQINDSSETHARVAMDTLLAIGPRPDVIVIQEAYANWVSTYIDELQRQTGRTWYGVFATHCQPGAWNGSACTSTWYQGIGIFSTYSIVDSSSKLFPFADCWTSARAGLRAGINVNGVVVQVFTTHLQTGGCTNDAQSRYLDGAVEVLGRGLFEASAGGGRFQRRRGSNRYDVGNAAELHGHVARRGQRGGPDRIWRVAHDEARLLVHGRWQPSSTDIVSGFHGERLGF
jgi:endonuclease/exonuclease/phosphatase family metal-dependent hydrolase